MKTCELWNVNRTLASKNFKIIGDPWFMLKFYAVNFKNSTLQILTEDICDALPNIERFSAFKVGLISVDENTFKKCTKLQSVNLNVNSLTSLPLGLFDSNVDLTTVSLAFNKLTQISGNLFRNNPNLEGLLFDHNQLNQFAFFIEIPISTKLKVINLSNNELEDVDIETMLEKCPNLEMIYFSGNKLSCGRILDIQGILKTKKGVDYWIGDCDEYPEDFVPTTGTPQNTLEVRQILTSTIIVTGYVSVIFIFAVVVRFFVKKCCT